MTVKDLREELREIPGDFEVVIWDGACVQAAGRVMVGHYAAWLKKKPIVFIQAAKPQKAEGEHDVN